MDPRRRPLRHTGLAVWFAVVVPVNAALSGWTPATLPADWSSFRDRWEIGHAVHAALFGLGFGALVIALLAETPANVARPRAPRAHWNSAGIDSAP